MFISALLLPLNQHVCYDTYSVSLLRKENILLLFTEKSPFSKYLGLPNELVISYAKGPVEQPGSAKAPEELACGTAFLHILIVI